MSGSEAMALLVREVKVRKNSDDPLITEEDRALTDAMQMGVTALRILSQWEEFILLGEDE